MRRATAPWGCSALLNSQFLSTLSLRRATVVDNIVFVPGKFLSTLSLRRATVAPVLAVGRARYFYPRSPCGERRQIKQTYRAETSISIHALLAESDAKNTSIAGRITSFLSTLSLRRATTVQIVIVKMHALFLSTLSLRRATRSHKKHLISQTISIHALLAESDHIILCQLSAPYISIHALLAESDEP